MGIVCTFIRVDDKTIDYLISNPKLADDYIDNNFASVNGKFHIEDDIIFYTDKAWEIALFLLKEADLSNDKIVSQYINGTYIDGTDGIHYIKHDTLKIINNVISTIQPNSFFTAYDEEKLIQQDVYRAGWLKLEQWDYVMKQVKTIQNAFARAAECNDGIIIYKS